MGLGDRVSAFRPIILVTGCGSGIGLALAKILYREKKYRVVVTSRQSSLEDLRKRFVESDRFLLRPLDVGLEDDRQRVIKEIEGRWGPVNILINNAGISYRAVVEHMSDGDEFCQMQINYFGPLALIRAVLPQMREKGRGKIINVSSVSGMLAMPTMASYSASKHALEGASEALWYETKPLGVDVCLIQPGFIRSNSFEKVKTTKGAEEAALMPGAPYRDYYQAMAPFIRQRMGLSKITPERVAMTILQVIRTQRPPLWVEATPDARLFYNLRRLMPRRWLGPLLFWFLPSSGRWGGTYSRRRRKGLWYILKDFLQRKA